MANSYTSKLIVEIERVLHKWPESHSVGIAFPPQEWRQIIAALRADGPSPLQEQPAPEAAATGSEALQLLRLMWEYASVRACLSNQDWKRISVYLDAPDATHGEGK